MWYNETVNEVHLSKCTANTRKGNTMPKLRLLLGRWGRTVLCQVLEQDESLRGYPEMKRLYDDDGFQVISASSPQLATDELYVRGAVHNYDNEMMSYKCSTPVQAAVLIDRIKTAVAVINGPMGEDTDARLTVPMEIVE